MPEQRAQIQRDSMTTGALPATCVTIRARGPVPHLPTPTAAFDWSIEPWGAALRCRPLSAIAQHGFTTRQLRLRGGPALNSDAWISVASLAGTALGQVARVRQVHGRSVRVLARGGVADADLDETPEGDAVVSSEPGLALAVLVADCVPILIADARAGVAAAVHAGWRGTAAGVAAEAIGAMRRLGADTSTLVAAIGPSIGPCCYEVGDELIDAFLASGHARTDVDRWFARVPSASGKGGSLRLDVAKANADQLAAAGVPLEQIYACGLCTQTYREVFDSYRADGAEAGRMAAVIGVPKC